MVALGGDEHLGLVLEPAERLGVQDAVAVPLEGGAQRVRRLGDVAHGPVGTGRAGAEAAGLGRAQAGFELDREDPRAGQASVADVPDGHGDGADVGRDGRRQRQRALRPVALAAALEGRDAVAPPGLVDHLHVPGRAELLLLGVLGVGQPAQAGAVLISLQRHQGERDVVDRDRLVHRGDAAQGARAEDQGLRERGDDLPPLLRLLGRGHRRVAGHLVDAVGRPVLPDLRPLAEERDQRAVREGPPVVGDVQAVAALVGPGQLDEGGRQLRAGAGLAAALRVVQVLDLPAVDEELDQIAEAAQAVPLLNRDDALPPVPESPRGYRATTGPGSAPVGQPRGGGAPWRAAWPAAIRATCTR